MVTGCTSYPFLAKFNVLKCQQKKFHLHYSNNKQSFNHQPHFSSVLESKKTKKAFCHVKEKP